MTFETALLWWQLNILTKRRFDALIQAYGDLDEVVITPGLLAELGCREETVASVLKRYAEFDVSMFTASLEKRGIRLLTINDDQYPVRLKQVADAPVFLSYRGDLSILDRPTIGVVGTREISHYGKCVVELFVPAFIRAHLVTVSGLAIGIDAAVASESIRAKGKTVAVLGSGLASIYPRRNEELAEDIVRHGGLLLSEFPPDLQPDKYTFPARNRIIAALSDGTLVCEAPEKSGSVITAELALDYNREVFAVPGQIFDEHYAGCHKLISSGEARLVTHPNDVLQVLGIIAPGEDAPVSYAPQGKCDGIVLAALTGLPQTIDDLVEATGCTASDVSIALTLLELANVARMVGNGEWVRR